MKSRSKCLVSGPEDRSVFEIGTHWAHVEARSCPEVCDPFLALTPSCPDSISTKRCARVPSDELSLSVPQHSHGPLNEVSDRGHSLIWAKGATAPLCPLMGREVLSPSTALPTSFDCSRKAVDKTGRGHGPVAFHPNIRRLVGQRGTKP